MHTQGGFLGHYKPHFSDPASGGPHRRFPLSYYFPLGCFRNYTFLNNTVCVGLVQALCEWSACLCLVSSFAPWCISDPPAVCSAVFVITKAGGHSSFPEALFTLFSCLHLVASYSTIKPTKLSTLSYSFALLSKYPTLGDL